jgi:hypothetical protein
MFTPDRITLFPGQARRQAKSLALLVLVWFALGSLLLLSSGCGTPGTRKSAVAAAGVQAPSVRQMPVHLAPAPPISTSGLDQLSRRR